MASVALLAACAATVAGSDGNDAPGDRAALLVLPDATVREGLARALAADLSQGGHPVAMPMLSDAALTTSAELIIEPLVLRDPMGVRLNGRERRPPALFRLVVDAQGDCVLTQPAKGSRQVLPGARCVAAGQ